jgi:hypothetical protein
MTALILTEGSPQWTIPAGGDVNVFGTAGVDALAFEEGASVTLDASFNAGNDTLYFEGDSTDFTVRNEGATVILTDGSGNEISLAAGTAGQTLVFGDGAVDLQIDTTAGTVNFGDQVLTDTDTAVTATVDDTTTSDDQFDGGDEPQPEVPTFTIAADADAVDEGGTATFTVTLSDAPAVGEEVTVDYATADGTAEAGTDYTAANGTLTFGAGETIKTFTVDTTDDFDIEDAETFTVTLDNVTGTIGGETPTIGTADAAVTITDNDVAVESYSLTADPTTVIEGNNVIFTVTALDADGNPAGVAEDTSFNYQITGVEVAGGTATPADDLGEVTGAVTIEAGQSTGAFTLTPINDGIAEGFEGFKVTLLDDAFETVAESGNVVINDLGDPTYSLAADEAAVDEGATATFTLETTNVIEGDEVAYTISGVDAADVDGDLTGVAVVGADGTATIEVALAEDNTTEGEETLTVTIDDDATATADVTVNDTSLDPDGAFLSIGNVSVAEGDSGTTTATFTVTLSEAPGAGEEVTVDYATADDTATAGTDYEEATGTLTFAEGDLTQTIDVTVNGDTDVEADETFNVTLSNVTGTIGGEDVLLPQDTAVGTITNDDVEPVEGETFTLTDGGAILTNTNSINSTPEDTYLADADDTINALSFLDNTTYIEDPSEVDSDTLNASIGAGAITPSIINIENINVRSISNTAELDFGGVEGVQTFTLTGTRDFTASDFDTAGDVLTTLASDATLTLEAGTATADDAFNLAVEDTDGGQFTFGDGAGNAENVAIDKVDLASNGTAANIVTLAVDGTGNQYTGIDALNLEGAAALDITTPYVADMVIASELTGELDLTLTGVDAAAAVDLVAGITGSVKTLTLTDYDGNAANQISTVGVTDLEELNLDSPGTASQNVDVAVDAGVEVGIISGGNNANDVAIEVDGADTDDASDLTLNVGGTAAITTGKVTAANIQNLSVNSTGHADGNSVNVFTTAALESLTVNAEVDFENSDGVGTAGTISMAAGEAAGTYDTFTVATSGEADIDLGDLTTAANINQIAFSSEGEGDRAFTVAAETGLKTDIGDDEAGVDITGAGTGTVTVGATGTILNTLRVDGASYAGTVEVLAGTAADIDADNFAGVDFLSLNDDYGTKTISNLDAEVTVKIVAEQNATNTTTISGSTTSRDILLALTPAATTTMGADTLQIDDAKTINFTTENTHTAGTTQTYTVTGLATPGAVNTININAAEDANFVLTNAHTTFAGSAGNRTFTLNMDGAGDVDLDGITSGANLDEIVLSASGEGTKDFGTITATDQADSAAVTFTGASDIVVDDIVDNMTTNSTTQKTVNFNGDGDAAIATMNITIEAGSTYTINSESTDATGENDIADASNIAFDTAAGTLEITGNQGLIVGSGTGLGMLTANGVENTVDASAFTGELELNLVRAGDTATDNQTVKVGTGDTDINLNAVASINEDHYTFEFSEDGIAEVTIENFSLTSGTNELDVLDFTNLTTGNAAAASYTASTGVVAFTGVDDTVTFAVEDFDNDGNDDLVGTSSLFDGKVIILGSVDDLALTDLALANFA